MRILCHRCGDPVSTEVPAGTLVRAWVECPECVEEEEHADEVEEARAEGYHAGQEAMRERAILHIGEAINTRYSAVYAADLRTYLELRRLSDTIRALEVEPLVSSICQCGNAAKDRPCKMSCPGSEVQP